jgi:hypothetical protein
MLVNLKSLKPNPTRDFIIDPMDPEVVKQLKESIQEDGFWGGVVCRQTDKGIEIAAGHHRVAAALAAGIREADVFVANGTMDDAAMVRIYARENATQRGNTGTAQTGSVAAAVRLLAKACLGGSGEFSRSNRLSLEEIRGNLASEKGLGRDMIVRFLDGIPGINDYSVKEALANLKASGDYARIIGEIQAEIEREHREALKALKRAEQEQARIVAEREAAERRLAEAEAARKEAAAKVKAAREEAERKRAHEEAKRAQIEKERAEALAKLAEKRRKEAEEGLKQFDALRQTRDDAAKAAQAAAARPTTFDFEGVAKHFKNAHQIDVFRKVVTGEGIAPYLAVAKQAALAAQIALLAKQQKKELTGAFIKDQVIALVLDAKDEQRRLTKQEEERKRQLSVIQRMSDLQRDFLAALRTLSDKGSRIKTLIDEWPKGLAMPISNEFRAAFKDAKKIIDVLNSKL